VIIDFRPFAGKSLVIENRLQQTNGRGHTGIVLPPGAGNRLLRIDVVLPDAADNSRDPAAISRFYPLPDTAAAPAVTRTFQFSRTNGQWTLNGRFMDCSGVRFSVTQNSAERWLLNGTSNWHHPMHVHLEEHQIVARGGLAPPLTERGRKDVTRLEVVEEVDVFMRSATGPAAT
jgi:FtsP/CotA-like multicopper oxidase with cupredoxin domain